MAKYPFVSIEDPFDQAHVFGVCSYVFFCSWSASRVESRRCFCCCTSVQNFVNMSSLDVDGEILVVGSQQKTRPECRVGHRFGWWGKKRNVVQKVTSSRKNLNEVGLIYHENNTIQYAICITCQNVYHLERFMASPVYVKPLQTSPLSYQHHR